MAKWSEEKLSVFDKELRELSRTKDISRNERQHSGLRMWPLHMLPVDITLLGTRSMYTSGDLIMDDEQESKGSERDGPQSNYWTQPIPPKDKAVSSPSEATKAKLRAKRKKRK